MKSTDPTPTGESQKTTGHFVPFSKILVFFNLEKKFVPFAYLGKSSLTAKGGFTGRYYHFPVPGAVLDVDKRDAAEMRDVPNLIALARG